MFSYLEIALFMMWFLSAVGLLILDMCFGW